MRDDGAHDELRELAALYALGALTQHEARSFEQHVAEGCESCRSELEGFEFVTCNLAFAAQEAEPPAGALEKLLRMTARSNSPGVAPEPDWLSQPQVSIRAAGGEWVRVAEGILIKPLYVDRASGTQTSLVRMAAGMSLPAHRHTGVEQFFILEGDCQVNGELLGPGDYHRAGAGTVHEVTYTEHGTLFLLVAPENYQVLSAQ